MLRKKQLRTDCNMIIYYSEQPFELYIGTQLIIELKTSSIFLSNCTSNTTL